MEDLTTQLTIAIEDGFSVTFEEPDFPHEEGVNIVLRYEHPAAGRPTQWVRYVETTDDLGADLAHLTAQAIWELKR